MSLPRVNSMKASGTAHRLGDDADGSWPFGHAHFGPMGKTDIDTVETAY